jgi:hypothetical protein
MEQFKKAFIGIADDRGNKLFEGDYVEVFNPFWGANRPDARYKITYMIPECAFMLVTVDENKAFTFDECTNYTRVGSIYDKGGDK